MSDLVHGVPRLEIKFSASASEGAFSGYASTFGNQDFGGDVIVKGAFKDSLKEWQAKGKLPKMLLQHGGGFMGSAEDAIPIGQWTKMEEDSKGLLVEGQLLALDTDLGKRLYAAMKAGELDGLSIGYRAKEFALGTKPGEPYRTIKRLDLKEVSVVLFGMNDRALVNRVKSAELDVDGVKTARDFERFLQEAGFSRQFAKTATARGFAAAARTDEAAGQQSKSNLAEIIRAAAAQIQSHGDES